jgi:two-component system, LuxR family, response regulator FixJ
MSEANSPSSSAVFVVNDDPQACKALADLIYSFGFQVNSCLSADEFLNSVDETQSGCVILDVRMPGIDGLEVHRRLVERQVPLSVIVLTAYPETRTTVASLRTGAIAVLEKPFKDQELWSFVQEGVERSEVEHHRRRHLASLEKRLKKLAQQDREVLKLMMEGVKNRSIAKRLEVSLRTVENRRRRVFEVMQAESVAQLTRMITEYEHGLIPKPEAQDQWLQLPFERVMC